MWRSTVGMLRASILWGSVLGVVALHSSKGIADQPPRPPYAVGHVPEPRIFAEGVVSTEDDESNGSFSLDGSEFFFAKANLTTTFPRLGILCVSRFRNGHWSEPEVLSFSGGQYLDLSPRLSPDGNTMFFASTRIVPGVSARALRIWSVRRTANGWGEPQALPAPINTADNNWHWGPSVTRDGTLYFASTRDGGQPHIFRSRFVNGAYTEPEKLGPEINSKFNESDPFVSPDERILVFASSGSDLSGIEDRPETLKGGGVVYPRSDLYVSFQQDGKWSAAKHLEHQINTVADENAPSITPDGKYLFFSSERSPFTIPTAHRLNYEEIEHMLHSTLNGHGNIFYISIDALDAPKPARPAKREGKERPR
jgi:Tol biopolymer transport system component